MLVSCVCPTANRQRFLPMLYSCIEKQTYHKLELVILDDGLDGGANCVYGLPANNCRIPVYYYRAAPGTYPNLGAKRNALNWYTRGDIIIHFDDDDWSAPDRVAEQVDCLLTTGMQVAGYHDIYYWQEDTGFTYKYRYAGMGSYASGTSLCYYREYWRTHQFPDMKVGEDSSFVFRAKALGVLYSTSSCGKIVAVSHKDSSAKPGLGGYQFPQVPATEFPDKFFEAVRSIR